MYQNNCVNKKTLPSSNILAEEIIIGHLLSDITARQYIFERITNNFFTLQKYQILYKYLSSISRKHGIAETINELWRQKLLKKVGGVSHMLHLAHKSQTISMHYSRSTYIEYFIEILHYNYIKRLIAQYSYSILQLGQLYQITIRQIENKASQYLATVSKNIEKGHTVDLRSSIGHFIHEISQSTNRHVIESGFRDLDIVTNGFKEGELIIVAGRPSMGKTSLAINIAHHIISNLKLHVQIFSLEMSKNEILDKIIALAANVSIHKIQQKAITQYDWSNIQDACKLLLSSALWINDNNSSSIEYIKEQCKSYISKKKA